MRSWPIYIPDGYWKSMLFILPIYGNYFKSPFQGNTKQELYKSIVRERVFFPGQINGNLMDLIEKVSSNKCSKVKEVEKYIKINNKEKFYCRN